MSMKKLLLLNQTILLILLIYLSVKKGIDLFFISAIVLSALSLLLNLFVEVQNARK